MIRDVEAGKADLGWAGSRAFDNVGVQSFDALHAPLLIDNYPLEHKVLESPLCHEMLEGLEPVGLVGIGILPGPMRKPLGVEAARATRGLPRQDDRVSSAPRWPSRRCARSAQAPRRSRRQGTSGLRRSRAADRRDRRQRIRQGRHSPRPPT